jgi:REP element-mobilizing transposase RayT
LRGLPFTADINHIINSVLARAQALYPVTICAVTFMGNHFHMLLYVQEPEHVVGFIDRIKTELAHAINTRHGTTGMPVWKQGYDALPVLTLHDVIRKLVYLYTNPQQARLVNSVDHYKRVCSWNMFLNNQTTLTVPWIKRTMVLAQSSTHCHQQQHHHTLTIDHFAWLHAFNNTAHQGTASIKQQVIDAVRTAEAELIKQHGPVRKQSLQKKQEKEQNYKPKKYSKRMWCICSDKPLRIAFIALVKHLRHKARQVLQRWKQGDFSLPYPLGLFPPSFPKLANLLIQNA